MADNPILSLQRRRIIQALGAATASALAPHRLLSLPAQAAASPVLPGIRFEEIAQQAGLHFVTRNCPTPNKNQPETMVAGIALFDYDNDGFLDIYCVNGAEIPSLVKTSPPTGIASSATITTAPLPTSLKRRA